MREKAAKMISRVLMGHVGRMQYLNHKKLVEATHKVQMGYRLIELLTPHS